MSIGLKRARVISMIVMFNLVCGLMMVPVQAQQNLLSEKSTVDDPTPEQLAQGLMWEPTPHSVVQRMLEMAQVTSSDVLVDLGSGDGRMVFAAVKRGAIARGVEFNSEMVARSKEIAQTENISDRATFVQGDIFETDFSDATVVTMFLLPTLNMRLRPTILEMKPGTRIVSNSFSMGDWIPDQSSSATEDCGGYCTAYLWVVPAKVAGTWKMPSGTLALTQNYQMPQGYMIEGGISLPIADARLKGSEISFSVAGKHYVGRVDGRTMKGMQGTTSWSAELQ